MTTKAIPSSDPSDLLFNAQKFDEAVTGFAPSYLDRFGRPHMTAQGATDSIRAYNSRGAWATATAYAAKDLVSSGGLWYMALDAHTSGATFAGDQAAHWRLYQGLEQFATVVSGNGVADNSAALAAAIALGLPIAAKGVLVINTPTTITVPIVDGMAQMFSTTSQVTIDNGLPVRPEWFGFTTGCIMRAINALPSAGGVVLLAVRTYPPSYNTATSGMFTARTGTPGVDYMVRKRIRIQGAKLPEYNSGETGLQNGSIIQGPFYISCECDGFEVDKIGVDSGTTVVTALYGGVEQDGFAIAQVNKTTPLIGQMMNIGIIRGLCKIGSTGVHAVLVESVNGGNVTYLEGRRGYHGVAFKSRNMMIGSLVGHGCAGNDVIIKSDTYAVCAELQIGNVVGGALGSVETGVAVTLQAGTANLGSIQISNLYAIRKDWALVVVAPSGIVADVNIQNLLGQSCTFGGYQLSGDCRRVKVGSCTINATPTSVIVVNATDGSNTIDELSIANATNGIDCAGKLNVSKVHFDTVTNGLVYSSAGARIYIGSYTSINLTNFWALQPALAGTWVSHAGGDAFKATLENGKVVLSGLLQSGANGVLTATLDARIRPTANYRFACLGYNGTTYAPVEVLVTTAGAVSASNFAAASSYLSLSGVQWPVPY